MLQCFAKCALLLITIKAVFGGTPQLRKCLIPQKPDITTSLLSLVHPQPYSDVLNSSVEDSQIVNMRCRKGYVLIGASSITCKNGTWDKEFPTCDVPEWLRFCFIPNNISENMIISLHPTKNDEPLLTVDYNKVLYIRCKSTYILTGPSTLKCKGHVWDKKFPTCDLPAQTRRCTLPKNSDLHIFTLHPINKNILYGDFVEDNESIHIGCKDLGHTLTGPSSLSCKRREWDNKIPKCERYCDATFWKNLSLKAICKQNKYFFECPDRIAPETSINMICASGYTRTPDTPQILKCLSDGSYDQIPQRCTKVCESVNCKGSDSIVSSNTTLKNPVQLNGCNIPYKSELENLIFSLYSKNETIELGSFVEDYEIIQIKCKSNYSLKGPPFLLCKNGVWDKKFPTCVNYCNGTSLRSLSLRVICERDSYFSECPEKIETETTIHVGCAFGYTRTPKELQTIKCLPSGNFDATPQHCEQNCKSLDSSMVFKEAEIRYNFNVVPWHVFIYEINSNIHNYKCAGSIVSPRIILTAAHCFSAESNLNTKYTKEYQIIAGSTINDYDKARFNRESQIVKVQDINSFKDYAGQQRNDIGFLRLATPLKYSDAVLPICLPPNLHGTSTITMRSNNLGYFNTLNSYNHTTRIQVQTLAHQDCIVQRKPSNLLADNKFCIYSDIGRVCQTDSGGGFYLQYLDPDTNEVTYRLRGVVSDIPAIEGNCVRPDIKNHITITDILNTDLYFRSDLEKAVKEDKQLLF